MFASRCAATSTFLTPPRKICFTDEEHMFDSQLPVIDSQSSWSSGLVDRMFPEETPDPHVPSSSSSGPAEPGTMQRPRVKSMTPQQAKDLWTQPERDHSNDKASITSTRLPQQVDKSSIFAMYGLDAPCSKVPHEVRDLVAELLKAKPAEKKIKPPQQQASAPTRDLQAEKGKPVSSATAKLPPSLQLQAQPVRGPSPSVASAIIRLSAADESRKFNITSAAEQTYICGYNNNKKMLS